MLHLLPIAPSSDVTRYDRDHLALYAALLDAERAGSLWQDAACCLMGLDPDKAESEACWRSHLERAQWIVGDGMAPALVAFGERKLPEHN